MIPNSKKSKHIVRDIVWNSDAHEWLLSSGFDVYIS